MTNSPITSLKTRSDQTIKTPQSTKINHIETKFAMVQLIFLLIFLNRFCINLNYKIILFIQS